MSAGHTVASGPEVGVRLPDIVAPNQFGESIDVHQHRGGGAVVVFFRSAVW